MRHPSQHGIALQKKHGQHFLRDQSVVDGMLSKAAIPSTASVMEIGCGDGFLTKAILQQPLARLWVFEIDHAWASYVQALYNDPRMKMVEEDILQLDWQCLAEHKPWILLSNLPYNITFPLLYKFQQYRTFFSHAILMMQEEVAQKLVATSGRSYGVHALFFQHYFTVKLLQKVSPDVFYPPPKVYSRLVYFEPRASVPSIEDEEGFWRFIKLCLRQPRRTLKNNLEQSHYILKDIDPALLALRAQQMSKEQFLQLWHQLRLSTAQTTA